MKILYAVQATGNGHISRAVQITPYLQKLGEVDIFLSGSNSSLNVPLPVKFRSKGISLFYDNQGGLDYVKMFTHNSWLRACKEAQALPVEQYDVIINDFEPITSKACTIKKKKSVQFSHQASFRSHHTPRPDHYDPVGECILKWYSTSSQYIGLHFKPYDDFILPPVIKQEIVQVEPQNLGHITVYLFGYGIDFYEQQLKKLPHIPFQCFVPNLPNHQPYTSGNITYFPIGQHSFTQSMITSLGVITGGGFETPAEALYLKKKLMCIPIKNHYEQYCNAAALNQIGVKTLKPSDMRNFSQHIESWLENKALDSDQPANNLSETIGLVVDKAAA